MARPSGAMNRIEVTFSTTAQPATVSAPAQPATTFMPEKAAVSTKKAAPAA